MSRTRSAAVLRRLAAATVAEAPATDLELLRAFLASRSESAFAELVHRHGPMVLAVCRRVLGHAHDAEDAFQAVFLVLARKAGSVRGENLAGWLYGVAVRTARGVRLMRDRRQKQLQRSQESGTRSQEDGSRADHCLSADSCLLTSELAAILDEELARLPDHYRLAVVLCELQGRSRKDAATELGIPEGTLSSRLAAARKKLADRLARRGVAATAALLATVLARDAAARLPEGLAESTARAAAVVAAGGLTNGLVSPAAAEALQHGLKAALADRLRAVVVVLATVGVGVVGWAVGPGAGSTAVALASDPQPPAPQEPNPVDLVKQLGNEDFALREAASKELRKLGTKAIPALLEGAKSENPEIARRSETILAFIRKDARDDLAKQFDPNGTADFDHPVWKRFESIAGNDKAARLLFAELIADARRLAVLDIAEVNPAGAGELYTAEVLGFHAKVQKLLDRPNTGDVRPQDVPWQDAVLALYLGTYPTTAGRMEEGWKKEGHLFIGLQESEFHKPRRPVLNRIFAAWLPNRTAPDTLERGFGIAVFHNNKGVLPFARKVAADEIQRSRELPGKVYAAALAAVAQFGERSDLPLFARYFDNTEVLGLWTKDGMPVDNFISRPPLTTQLGDQALGLALLLFDKDPAELGFEAAATRFRRENGRPAVGWFEPYHFGFPNNAVRDAAHKKAREWLDAQTKPADPPQVGAKFWPWFAKIAGDDQASRELFALIASDKATLDLLELITSPDTDGDWFRRYLARRDALNAMAEEKDPNEPGVSRIVPLPLPAVAGWLLTGTYPVTRGNDPDGGPVRFLDVELGQKPLADALKADSPVSRPLRKLVAAWLANRGDEYSALKVGLNLALRYDIPESLATARRVIKDSAKSDQGGVQAYAAAYLRSQGMLVVGKYGTKDDLPLLQPFFDDPFQVTSFIQDPPGERRPGYAVPIDGKDYTTLVGDVAIAMSIRLAGGDLREFGFLWPTDRNGKPVGDPFTLSNIGFISHKERAAAHKKAREWLDAQKKPEPPKEDREPTAGLLKDLDDLDQMRQGDQTDFAAIEKRGEQLLAKYPDPADQGLIYFTLTRVYSNSGITRTWARVEKYGRLTLKWDKDPVRRGLIYSDLASAAEVATAADPLATEPFAVKRRRAAGVILEGYRELLPLNLPDVAPELPVVEKIGEGIDTDPVEAAKARERHAAQMKVRREAEFTRDMVHRRNTYAAQLRYLYGREPKDDAELRQLATDALKDPKAVADLLDRVWEKPKPADPPADKPARTFPAPAGVGALAFGPKGDHLLVGSADLSVQVWNMTSGRQVGAFRVGAEGSNGTFRGLDVSPDGRRVAARYFVGTADGEFLFGLEGHVAEITRMRYDRNGKRIVTASFDGTVRIWEAETGKPVKTIEAHMGRKVPAGPQTGFGRPGPAPERFEGRGVWDVAFSPDGKRIVSGGVDGMIRVWDANTGKDVWGEHASEALMAVAYLPNGQWVASGGQDGTIRLWNADTGKEGKKLSGHTDAVAALAVTADGKRLVSASYDKTVRVWDLETGQELRCFRGHTNWVYAIAVSPDGRTVASGGEDRTVRLWAMP